MSNFSGRTVRQYAVGTLVESDLALSVYQASDSQSQRELLLWTAFPHRPVSQSFRSALLKQLELLNLLEHAHLLPVIDFFEEDGQVFWVTPRVTARRLAEMVAEPRSEKQAAALAAQVAAALEYLHGQNLLHGGLSPENVLVEESGHVYLQFYGLSSLLNQEAAARLPERVLGIGLGNPAYLSPEQIAGRELSPQTDLYALGALYFALLNGKAPFEALTPAETAIRAVSAPQEWPKKLRARVSSASLRLVHRCMDKQPSGRLSRATEARSLLERLAAGRWTRVRVHKEQMRGAPYHPNWPARLVLLAAILLLAGWIVYTNAGNLAALAGLVTPTSEAQVRAPTAVLPAAGAQTPTPPPARPTATPTAAQAVQSGQPEVTPTEVEAVGAAESGEQPSAQEHIPPVLVSTALPGQAEPVTAANAGQLRETVRLGTGKFNQSAWLGDSATIALASSAGVFIVTVGQRNTSYEIVNFLDTQEEAASVRISNDGATLAVGLQTGEIQLWDWRNAVRTAVLTGHSARVSRILFSPNGRQMISASYDNTIRVWSYPGGESSRPIPVGGPVKDIAVSPDGRFIASVFTPAEPTDNRNVRVWDAFTGSKLREFYHAEKAEAVAIAQTDGKTYVAAGHLNGAIKEWNIDSGAERGESIIVGRRVWSLYYNNNASTLYIGMEDGLASSETTNQLKISMAKRQVSVPALPAEWQELFGANFEFLSHAEPSPDGSLFLTVTWDGSIRVYNISALRSTSAVLTTLPLFDIYANLRFSPDSAYLLAGGIRKNVFVWKAETNSEGARIDGILPPGDPFSASSSQAAIITDRSGTKIVQVFKTDSLALSHTYSDYAYDPNKRVGPPVSFALDDRVLAAGNQSGAKAWDINTGLEILRDANNYLGCMVTRSKNDGTLFAAFSPAGAMTTWDARAERVCQVTGVWGSRLSAISPDRRWLAGVNPTDGRLEILDMDSGKTTLTQVIKPAVTALAFSSSGLLLTGGTDGSLVLWSAEDGQVIHTIQHAHFRGVRGVAFSPDSRRIASGGTDGTVRIWEVRPAR